MSEEKDLETAQEPEEVTAPKADKPAKASKTTKPAKKKGNPIARWFREMKSELKKVQWPTWKQTWNNTITVIVCVLIIGVFIWGFDLLAKAVITALLDLAKG